jgi:hypothetical protein
MPPTRIVDEPVRANFTPTGSPAARWSEVAVVESMSSSPAASDPMAPDVR